MTELEKEGLRLTLCRPGEYYRGTRFDHAGVFRRIEKDGYVYADEWYDSPDEFRHDNVCGASEEFMTVDFGNVEPGGTFLKPGVGLLLRPDAEPYDRFRLYDTVDPGKWEVEAEENKITYRHVMEGIYRYTKCIEIVSGSSFVIRHGMEWKAEKALEGHLYNHNFFTFGGRRVSPSRRLEFAFRPVGTWRDEYDNVRIADRSIEFTGEVSPSKSVFMGDLHNEKGETAYDFTVSEGDRKVRIIGSSPAEFCVFWSSPRVACIEPYTPISLRRGESFGSEIEYTLK